MNNILLLEDLPEIRAWLKVLILQVFPQSHIQEAARIHDALELVTAIKFDLALQLGKLDAARELLRSQSAAAAAADAGAPGASAAAADAGDLVGKWKQLLDLALATSRLELAEEAALAASDLGALLLLYTATGDVAGLLRLGALAEEAGKDNVAFLAYHSAGDAAGCARVLAASGQTLEAEVFQQVYAGAEQQRAAQEQAAGAQAEEQAEEEQPLEEEVPAVRSSPRAPAAASPAGVASAGGSPVAAPAPAAGSASGAAAATGSGGGGLELDDIEKELEGEGEEEGDGGLGSARRGGSGGGAGVAGASAGVAVEDDIEDALALDEDALDS